MTFRNDIGAATGAEPARKAPRISIITTNYNYGHMLGDTIRSVLAQTYDDIEYIFVDDGSMDNSLEVARSFEGVTVLSQTNGGQVSAAKRAIGHVTGDIVLFLDSDDQLYPDACARVAEAFDPGVSLYHCGLDIVDSKGARIGSYPDAPPLSDGHIPFVLRHGYFPASPTSGNAFAADHVRRMLDVTGDDLRQFVDGYLIYSAPFFGRVKEIEGRWGSYTVHGANVSLSAGTTRRSAERMLRNAIFQRSGITKALALIGRPAGKPSDYLTAWQLRHLLILRHCYGVSDILPAVSSGSIARQAVVKFLTYPDINLKQRLQNMLLVGSLLLGYKGLGKRLIPATV